MEITKLSKKITELEFQAQREAKRTQAIGLEKEAIARQLIETKEELVTFLIWKILNFFLSFV